MATQPDENKPTIVLSTVRGPMRRASMPRSALSSARDSVPSGSANLFATSPAIDLPR